VKKSNLSTEEEKKRRHFRQGKKGRRVPQGTFRNESGVRSGRFPTGWRSSSSLKTENAALSPPQEKENPNAASKGGQGYFLTEKKGAILGTITPRGWGKRGLSFFPSLRFELSKKVTNVHLGLLHGKTEKPRRLSGAYIIILAVLQEREKETSNEKGEKGKVAFVGREKKKKKRSGSPGEEKGKRRPFPRGQGGEKRKTIFHRKGGVRKHWTRESRARTKN